ncbi:carboxypeptidase [bacterium]|nr:MAG: carboxypeptidase [bacterium]
MADWLARLVAAESPSHVAESQRPVQALVAARLEAVGLRTRVYPGRRTGGFVFARPPGRPAACQLLVGHTDTVWPLGTLDTMPLEVRGPVMAGPGVFDMKAGLAIMVFALEALRALDLAPAVAPVVLINADEEIGSRESGGHIARLARLADRALILEPGAGEAGALKTARKGIGAFQVVAHGRAAHAGLEPERGASAILELAHVIRRLHDLNDPASGVSVNVGVIEGGLRSNVVAPEARAAVDVRVPTMGHARAVEAAILGLAPTVPGVSLTVTGSIGRRPMERTPANRRLWAAAHAAGRALGLDLAETAVGGGSDGNITSQFTATLDGLGAVGDGAHARHEHVRLDRMAERAALLALLLLAPPLGRAGAVEPVGAGAAKEHHGDTARTGRRQR